MQLSKLTSDMYNTSSCYLSFWVFIINSWGRILMMDQLKRRGWEYWIDGICAKEMKKQLIIFLHCSKAVMLWHIVYALFGIEWVMHYTVRETLLGWYGSFIGETRKKKAWRVAPLFLFWAIWKERNRRAFERNIKKENQAIKQTFMYIFWEWVRMYIGEIALCSHWTSLIGQTLSEVGKLFFM